MLIRLQQHRQDVRAYLGNILAGGFVGIEGICLLYRNYLGTM